MSGKVCDGRIVLFKCDELFRKSVCDIQIAHADFRSSTSHFKYSTTIIYESRPQKKCHFTNTNIYTSVLRYVYLCWSSDIFSLKMSGQVYDGRMVLFKCDELIRKYVCDIQIQIAHTDFRNSSSPFKSTTRSSHAGPDILREKMSLDQHMYTRRYICVAQCRFPQQFVTLKTIIYDHHVQAPPPSNVTTPTQTFTPAGSGMYICVGKVTLFL